MKGIVLAAGQGKRLLSEEFNMPKVLRRANNVPLLRYVLNKIDFLKPSDITIVVGYMKEKVIEEISDGYVYAVQKEQLGTGHAVASAKEEFKDYDGDVIVLYGDMPLLKKETYQNLIDAHKKEGGECTILACITNKKLPYGRIIKNEKGYCIDIVEEKDCTPEQKEIKELNIGVYVFNSKTLFAKLGELKNDNSQGEYYLTDVAKILAKENIKVNVFSVYDETEIVGVNTAEELDFVEKALLSGKY